MSSREIEQQNDDSIESLSDKLRRLRNATGDIYDQSEAQMRDLTEGEGILDSLRNGIARTNIKQRIKHANSSYKYTVGIVLGLILLYLLYKIFI